VAHDRCGLGEHLVLWDEAGGMHVVRLVVEHRRVDRLPGGDQHFDI
jgi:hypothetical protein